MNIFDYAIQMEKDAEKFYRDLVQKTDKIGFKNILNMLADDEVKHAKTFENLKTNSTTNMETSKILSASKNIFQKMKDQNIEIITGEEEVDLYTNAREIELNGINAYEEILTKIETENQRSALLKIIDEEKRHYHLLNNLVDLLLQPKQWIENGEFVHLEDY